MQGGFCLERHLHAHQKAWSINPFALTESSLDVCRTGWGMTGLDRLLRAALTAAQLSNPLAAQPAAEPQHSKAASHNSPSVSPPDLLLSTVTTLAHMLETQASFDSSQSKFQRGRQQSNSADAARQLGVILSLVVFVGSLSCSSGSGSSSAAQAVSADSDAQTHEDGSGAERRQVSQDEAVPETDGAESPRLQQGINLDDSSQDRQRAVQLDGGGQPQQAHTVAECLRACQEACLQVQCCPMRVPFVCIFPPKHDQLHYSMWTALVPKDMLMPLLLLKPLGHDVVTHACPALIPLALPVRLWTHIHGCISALHNALLLHYFCTSG